MLDNLNINKSIIATLVYYDILDYPLTSFEIWKYLFSKDNVSLTDVIKELESQDVEKYISEYQGFYFLKDRQDLVERRLENNKISQSKFKIIRRAVFWLRFSPYVRMIAVTGRVAMKNAQKESDLDFLVVMKKGKIFTGRIIFTFLTHLIGKRRYRNKVKNRICLNYFLTDESLEINHKDIYSSSEYSFIWPIFGQDIFWDFQKKNEWIKNFHPNFILDLIPNSKLIKDSSISDLVRKIGEFIFDFDIIEKYLKKWQIKRIMSDSRTYMKGSAVMAGSEALVFLPKPHGPKVYEKFNQKIKLLGI